MKQRKNEGNWNFRYYIERIDCIKIPLRKNPTKRRKKIMKIWKIELFKAFFRTSYSTSEQPISDIFFSLCVSFFLSLLFFCYSSSHLLFPRCNFIKSTSEHRKKSNWKRNAAWAIKKYHLDNKFDVALIFELLTFRIVKRQRARERQSWNKKLFVDIETDEKKDIWATILMKTIIPTITLNRKRIKEKTSSKKI